MVNRAIFSWGQAPDGIHVVDLGCVLTGPFWAQLLADFSADVIKIERLGGDENRFWPPGAGLKVPAMRDVQV